MIPPNFRGLPSTGGFYVVVVNQVEHVYWKKNSIKLKVPAVEYVKLARVQDFKRTRIKSFRLLARPVGIIKQKNGTFIATEVGCKHENADLTEGRMQGDVVTCPWHGWKYNLLTGECLWGSDVCLRRHGIRIEGDDIYVSLRPLEPEPTYEDWGPPLK